MINQISYGMRTTRTWLTIFTLMLIITVMPAFAQEKTSKTIPLDFVDPQKDPTYYLDRYYNEPAYKSWFDRNYPEYTIEEAVGVSTKSATDKIVEIIPQADATLVETDNTSLPNIKNISQFILAVCGLGILFGAVLGIKRKNNCKQGIINTIKQKLTRNHTKPIDILQLRLAKGEITTNEYNELMQIVSVY